MLNLSEEVISYIFELTADYTISRYPDVTESVPYEHYDKPIACQKVESAKKVFEFLKDSYKELIEVDNNA